MMTNLLAIWNEIRENKKATNVYFDQLNKLRKKLDLRLNHCDPYGDPEDDKCIRRDAKIAHVSFDHAFASDAKKPERIVVHLHFQEFTLSEARKVAKWILEVTE